MIEKVILPESDVERNCWYLVNRKEAQETLSGWGFSKVCLVEKEVPDIGDIERLKLAGNAVVLLMFHSDDAAYRATLRYRSRDVLVFSTIDDEKERGKRISDSRTDAFTEFLVRSVERADRVLEDRGFFWIRDYHKNICGNCGEKLSEGVKYCTYCGTKKGEGRYEARKRSGGGDILYGCPRIIKRYCPTCERRWTEWAIDNEKVYCSDCGSRGIIEKLCAVAVYPAPSCKGPFLRAGQLDLLDT